MNGKEALATLALTTAFMGGPAVANEFSDMSDARARAVTADTCQLYNVDGLVTKKTLDCLSEGWVPGGKAVEATGVSVGDPAELISSLKRAEVSRGRHFDPSGSIWWSLGGLAFGCFAVYKIEGYEEREAQKRAQPTDEEQETHPEHEEPFEDDQPSGSD